MGEITVMVKRLRLVSGRYYWRPSEAVRHRGYAAEALGADPVKAVQRANELNDMVDARGAPERGETVGALISLYTGDPAFPALAAATQKTYLSVLREIDRRAGHVMVNTITRKAMKATYRAILPRGQSIAAMHMRLWHLLLALAVDEEWISANPAGRMRISLKDERDRIWHDHEIDRYCAACEAEGRPSIALAVLLGLYTGQRPSDLLVLPWSGCKGGVIKLTQKKTGAKVEIPILPELQAALDQTPRESTLVLVNEKTGQPWVPGSFDYQFRRIKRLAELDEGLQFRDLRRTMATRLGEASATDAEIMAITGHKDRKVVGRYVRSRPAMARNAMAKLRKE